MRLLVLGLLLLSFGCTRNPSAPSMAPAERLAGTWRWVSALDVKTQQLHTPMTEGFDAELHFTAESRRSGTFTYTRAGMKAVHGRFEISFEDAPGNDFIVLEPAIDFLKRNAWVAAGRDSLHLGGVMELGYNSRYARVAQ